MVCMNVVSNIQHLLVSYIENTLYFLVHYIPKSVDIKSKQVEFGHKDCKIFSSQKRGD